MSKIITISREYGAGGHTIGTEVAKRLGIPFYDRDIVRETAKASGFDLELIEQESESSSKSDSIFKSICSASSIYFHDTQDAIHEVQRAVMVRLAQQGPCVILGRCGGVMLREAGIECTSVFIHANDIFRAARISELTGITDPAELNHRMMQKDDGRRNYFNHYSHCKWGDCHNFTLTLDSGMLGYETCIQLIMAAAQAGEEKEETK